MTSFAAKLLRILGATVLTLALSHSGAMQAGEKATIHVSAAASVTGIMEKAARAFEKEHGVTVALNLGASGTLAKQVEQGAPCDYFLSAAENWATYLQKAGLLPSPKIIACNRLVIIAPKDSAMKAPSFESGAAAPAVADGEKVAIGDPASVPAGQYAKEAFGKLGWWPALDKNMVLTKDVRAALRMVELGEAAFAVVYATDAAASANVKVVATIPQTLHAPVTYHAGLTKAASPYATAFAAYMDSPAVAALFVEAGFTLPAATAPAKDAAPKEPRAAKKTGTKAE